MSMQLRCENGHEWAAAGDTVADCPQCGAAQLDDYPDELPPPPKPLPASTAIPHATPPAPGELPPVPGYEVLRELGRGGMGVVYLARDRRLQRHAALKMILTGAQSGPEERARFRTEAETVARLQHPNIVQIFEVGEWNGQPYFALEYLDGGNLAKQLGQPFSPAAAVPLAETLARAVQYAHDQGVIHRDLKPGNILLQKDEGGRMKDEKNCSSFILHPSSFVPKITDFGLAKRLDTQSGSTQSGSILGTPCYMAPEQASGRVKEIGPAADVYALGAILYELLTGRPPFLGESSMETVLHVIQDEPAPPRLLNSHVPLDLETICLKCLRKEPANRYESAGAMADDLRRFAEGRPILARPVGALERGWRMARRNRTASGMAAALLLTLIAGIVVATYFAVQSAGRAEKNLEMKHIAERRLYLARMNLASRAWDEGQVVRVLELLNQTRPENTDGIDLRGFEWYYLWRVCRENDLRVVKGHDGPIHQVAWSSRGVVASAGEDRLVKLWNGVTGELLAELAGHDRPVYSVAFAPHGNILVSGDEWGNICIWDVARRETVRTLKAAVAPSRCIAFSRDGQWLLVSAGNSVSRWKTDSWQGGFFDSPKAGDIFGLVWADNDTRFVAVGTEGMVVFRNMTSNKAFSVRHSEGYLSALTISADGHFVASGGLDGHIKIWDATTPKVPEPQKEYVDLAGAAACLAFSADGRFLVSAGITGAVTVRDLQTGFLRRIAHTGPVESFGISPDQTVAVIAGSDGMIKWARINLRPEPNSDHSGKVYAVTISPDGRTAASGSRDGKVRLWDVATGQSRGELSGSERRVLCIAFNPTSDQLAVGGDVVGQGGVVWIWDLRSRRETAAWKAHSNSVWGVAFTPDGKRLATAGYTDAKVVVWDVESRQEVVKCNFPAPSERAWCVAISPDGRRIAAGGSKGVLAVWDAATGDVQLKLDKGEGWVWAVAFSPDGTSIAAGLESGGIARWDAASGAPLPDLPGHHAIVRTLGFFPDSHALYSGGEDGAIKLWDLATREERARLMAHDGAVWALAIAPDGRTLFSGGVDKRVRFWRAASNDEVNAASR